MSWRSDWETVRGLANPRDGYADKYFNRYLSRPITVVLARTPVTPNQVTIVSGAIGLVAGWLIARGGYWDAIIGALVLQVSVVFDDVDGELARLKRHFSEWGEFLDNTMDTITHLAVFAGIAVAVGRTHGGAAVFWPAVGLFSGVAIVFVVVTYLEQRVFAAQAEGAANGHPMMRRLQSYVELLSGRDSSVLVLAFAVADRLQWFLYGAAVGAHVFWISVLLMWRRCR